MEINDLNRLSDVILRFFRVYRAFLMDNVAVYRVFLQPNCS